MKKLLDKYRLYLISGLVMLLAGSVSKCVYERDQKLQAEAVQAVYQERADSLREVADAAVQAAAEQDSVAQEARARAESAREAAEDRARAARAAQPEVVERIVSAPDTAATRAAVEELQEVHQEEVSALTAALAAADSVIAAQDLQISAEQRARARVESALEAQRDVSRATSSTQRGVVETWGERAIVAGVTYGFVKLVGG